jgi:tyrosine-specific transport protein
MKQPSNKKRTKSFQPGSLLIQPSQGQAMNVLLLVAAASSCCNVEAFVATPSIRTTRGLKSFSYSLPKLLSAVVGPDFRNENDDSPKKLPAVYNTRRQNTASIPAAFATVTKPSMQEPLEHSELTTQAPVDPSSLLPVVSAALLLASNTIGTSCLVLPEICRPIGLIPSFGLFAGAYGINLLSGLAIAKVTIQAQRQREEETRIEGQQSQISESSISISSFQDLAAHELGPMAAKVVSVLSMFVNACAFSFDASRMGGIAQDALSQLQLHLETNLSLYSPSSSELMLIWTGLLAMLVATLNNQRLSVLASLNVTLLMLSFGSVLVPALQHLPYDTFSNMAMTMMGQPEATSSFAAIANAADATTFQTETLTASMIHAAPVILMAMVYQNIVPSIVKLLKYDWNRIVAAMTLGSLIPLMLYMAWCLVSLASDSQIGNGAGEGLLLLNTNSLVLTVFSVVTVMGSSLGSIMSLSEEIQPYQSSATTTKGIKPKLTNDRYSVPSVGLSICIPLAANLIIGEGADFTPALALAGSVGSPLLYGLIPVMMLYAQYQRQRQTMSSSIWNTESESSNLMDKYHGGDWSTLLAKGLPLVGILSLVVFGHELVSNASQGVA